MATVAPVDDVVALVDEPLVVETDKDLAHGLGQPLVQGEPLPGPVHGSAHSPDLVQDAAAVLLLPAPGLLHELFPAQVVAGLALGGQLPLHHVLGGDAGVVHARHPKHLTALLAVKAAQDILNGEVQGVAHVQGPGDVGRRDDDGVGFARCVRAIQIGREGLVALPVGDPAGFHVLGLVPFGQGGFRHEASPKSVVI